MYQLITPHGWKFGTDGSNCDLFWYVQLRIYVRTGSSSGPVEYVWVVEKMTNIPKLSVQQTVEEYPLNQ